MNLMAVVGILMLYTYATAIAAPSPLRYENPKSNLTLPLALSTTANALPPDPNIINIPSVGLLRCSSYANTPWENDVLRVLILVTDANRLHVDAGQGYQPIAHPQRYTIGHAAFNFDPSPSLTWLKWSAVRKSLVSTALGFTPATFSFTVSAGPTGFWNGSLTTT